MSLFSLPYTHFIELPCDDCEAAPLNGLVASMPLAAQDAVDSLISKNMRLGSQDLSVTYTVGCFGEDDQMWDYSHYEIYEPQSPTLPSMVILRYRPHNPDAAALFFAD